MYIHINIHVLNMCIKTCYININTRIHIHITIHCIMNIHINKHIEVQQAEYMKTKAKRHGGRDGVEESGQMDQE